MRLSQIHLTKMMKQKNQKNLDNFDNLILLNQSYKSYYHFDYELIAKEK